MNRKETLIRARIKREPQIIFNCNKYSISIIPLNYEITIKNQRKPEYKSVDKKYYSCLDNGINNAHKIALSIIRRYFMS